MNHFLSRFGLGLCALCLVVTALTGDRPDAPDPAMIGKELSLPTHLRDGEEHVVSTKDLIEHGRRVFSANWTDQEGGGRPMTKGTGTGLSDPTEPLRFPRNFNRLSAPDANSCMGCHNAPFGIAGGGGDFVTNVFVLAQRFDDVTFNPDDPIPTKGAKDERGAQTILPTVSNNRSTLGMFGAGYIEMLARQMTRDLQMVRDSIGPGEAKPLVSKGVRFGILMRGSDGKWDTSLVEGIPAKSLGSSGSLPSLVIRPFHQAGAVVSLREFSNNAFNHHHGIQSTERFGVGTDPDGDGKTDELTRADVTAASIFQATLGVPGRVIPRDPLFERAIRTGESRFRTIGCADCHIPKLPLTDEGWVFTEPNPYNPPGNLRPGDAPPVSVDLNSPTLPGQRLKAEKGVTWVPAFTDLKLHDICAGPDDPNAEPLDMQQPAGTPGFFAGNRKFLTKKLWGAANEPPYFHHGKFTTLRQAILAHDGEARASRQAYERLSAPDQDAVVEFLKSLQVLPPDAKSRIVDENFKPREWKE